MLANGEPCCWVNAERNVCSNPSCIKAEARRVKEDAREARPRKYGERFKGMGYGQIVMELRRDRQRRRRKRSAA